MPSDQLNESAGPRKSWFAKHWKWYIPLVVPLVSAVVVIAATNYFKRDETTADRVASCRKAHDLQHDKQQKQTGNQTIFASCTWPPNPGVTATDGYSEVAVLSGPGPAQSEISGANVMDTFRPLCSTVELTYAYERQGLAKVEPAIKAETGSIFHVTGTRYPENPTSQNWETGDTGLKTSIFAKPDEVIVLRNGSYTLFDVRCV